MDSVSNEKTILQRDVSPVESMSSSTSQRERIRIFLEALKQLETGEDNDEIRKLICTSPAHSSEECPENPGKICFLTHDASPYVMQHIPRGANYDRVNYRVICGCGDVYFDEEKWMCPKCGGQSTCTRLVRKYCVICSKFSQHCTEECPEDKIAAAEHRAIKDLHHSRKMYHLLSASPTPAELAAVSRATQEYPKERDRVVKAAREEALNTKKCQWLCAS